MATRRIPIATYRLQFNHRFTFADATGILEYLHALGVSDLYVSPLFQSAPDSTHGYDVCGFDRLNPVLGTAADYAAFLRRKSELGLGMLLDMVPNHMGNDLSNAWWCDLLKHGRRSRYANWFDIDWQPLKSDLRDRVLLPVLGNHYARVLAAGELQLRLEKGELVIAYYDRKLPVSPETSAEVVAEISAAAARDPELSRAGSAQLNGNSPAPPTLDGLEQALARALEKLNGQPGDPRSFDRVHQLLSRQHYRLAFWKVGPEEINYRRFFDVTTLASLRMELPEVFDSAHALVLSMIQDGVVTGLRIDHPDGLWNPREYFDRLQQLAAAALGTSPSGGFYVVAEKILTGEETLPENWKVDGTTGYEFLNRLNGLFIQQENGPAFLQLYQSFTGQTTPFDELVLHNKRLILQRSLISELSSLAHRAKALATATREGQDFTFSQLHAALREVIAAFPVYRTYVEESTTPRYDSGRGATAGAGTALPAIERERIQAALAVAGRVNPGLDPAVLEFVGGLLLLEPVSADLDAAGRESARHFVMRFQQLTGPVMAKGLEDTTFYNYYPFVSLNEVGGEPARFGTGLSTFHEHNERTARRWPHTLLATATHDTKRGEDVRARLNVLSEIPGPWREHVLRWRELNSRARLPTMGGTPCPSPNDEYLLYQTLAGTWLPGLEKNLAALAAFRERMRSYMLKAIRESKAHTSWTEPNEAYERGTVEFVETILEDPSSEFLTDFTWFLPPVVFFGQLNSLSQVLLKITSPGVPDFYQGTELWDFSLVDPDNRRPVDYELRRGLLRELEQAPDPAGAARASLERSEAPGLAKLFVTWRALRVRQSRSALYREGIYRPLRVRGENAGHVIAFAREHAGRRVITLTPRFAWQLMKGEPQLPLGPVWGDTRVDLEAGSFRNTFTGEPVGSADGLAVGDALARFPLALLEEE